MYVCIKGSTIPTLLLLLAENVRVAYSNKNLRIHIYAFVCMCIHTLYCSVRRHAIFVILYSRRHAKRDAKFDILSVAK